MRQLNRRFTPFLKYGQTNALAGSKRVSIAERRCPEAFTLPRREDRQASFLKIEGRLGHTLTWLWQPSDVVARPVSGEIIDRDAESEASKSLFSSLSAKRPHMNTSSFERPLAVDANREQIG